MSVHIFLIPDINNQWLTCRRMDHVDLFWTPSNFDKFSITGCTCSTLTWQLFLLLKQTTGTVVNSSQSQTPTLVSMVTRSLDPKTIPLIWQVVLTVWSFSVMKSLWLSLFHFCCCLVRITSFRDLNVFLLISDVSFSIFSFSSIWSWKWLKSR